MGPYRGGGFRASGLRVSESVSASMAGSRVGHHVRTCIAYGNYSLQVKRGLEEARNQRKHTMDAPCLFGKCTKTNLETFSNIRMGSLPVLNESAMVCLSGKQRHVGGGWTHPCSQGIRSHADALLGRRVLTAIQSPFKLVDPSTQGLYKS